MCVMMSRPHRRRDHTHRATVSVSFELAVDVRKLPAITPRRVHGREWEGLEHMQQQQAHYNYTHVRSIMHSKITFDPVQ